MLRCEFVAGSRALPCRCPAFGSAPCCSLQTTTRAPALRSSKYVSHRARGNFVNKHGHRRDDAFRNIRMCAAAVEQHEGSVPAADALSLFLGWAVANGVQGLGTAESKVAMYEGESGERGLLSTQDITAGEVLLRVPLKLALTDFAEDEESNQLLYEAAPWSVRLSAKLLREVAAGSQAPRWPYLQVLPQLVPAPLETLSWEEMQAMQYAPGLAALHEYNWLVSDAFSRCSPEAVGGASAEQFQWAMSVVHSRTFANAAPGGGVGVRMLVPLVDMFNHGGDETGSGLLNDPERIPTDNVRWDVVQSGEEWEMVVTATQDVEQGYQLLLCYGERGNDDFFLHYGFVPEANPHESVSLFNGLEEALDWHYNAYPSQLPIEEAEQRYRKALEAAVQQQKEALAQLPKLPRASVQEDGQQQHQLLLHAGGRVDSALMTAFGAVSGADAQLAEAVRQDFGAGATLVSAADARRAEEAVAKRCLELLQGMPTSLLQDFAALWADATARGDEEGACRHMQLLEHYRQELHQKGQLAGDADIPIEAYTWQTFLSIKASDSPAIAGNGSSSSEANQAEAGTMGQLSPGKLLVLRYRMYKKMVLWDAVLAIAGMSSE